MVTQAQAVASSGKARKATPPGRGRAANCRCGQQLDCCDRQHCPRCGRSIQNN
jgi:hypothetical protein